MSNKRAVWSFGHCRKVESLLCCSDLGLLFTGSSDSTVGIYDLQQGRRLQTLTSGGLSVSSLAISLPDRLVFGGGFGLITVWDLNTAEVSQQISSEDIMNHVEHLAYDPAKRSLYGWSRDEVAVIDLDSGKCAHTLSSVVSFYKLLAFDADSGMAAVRMQGDKAISIVDLQSGSVKYTLEADVGGPSKNLLHVAQDCLFTFSNGTLSRWSLSKGERVFSVEDWFDLQLFNPDANRLYAVADECSVVVMNASNGEVEQTIDVDHEVHTLHESADGKLFVSYCKGEVGVWEPDDWQNTQVLAAQDWSYRGLEYDREADELVAVAGRYCDTWNATNLSFKQTWEREQPKKKPAKKKPAKKKGAKKKGTKKKAAKPNSDVDNQRLHVWTPSRECVAIWDRVTDSCVGVINRKDDKLSSVVLDAVHRRVYCGTRKDSIEVFDVDTSKRTQILKGHKDFIRALDVDPVSGQLFSTCGSKEIKIWDTASGECKTTIAYDAILTDLSYDPAREQLFLVDGGGYECDQIKQFDLKTGKVEFAFCGHYGSVRSITLDHENRRLFSTADDSTIRVWDIEGRQCIGVMRTDDDMNAIAIVPESDQVLSISNDGKKYGHYMIYDDNGNWLNSDGKWTVEEL